MPRTILSTLTMLALLTWSARAAEPKSVPKAVESFKVLDVTGPHKGTECDYFVEYAGQPIVLLFSKTIEGKVPDVLREVVLLSEKSKPKKLALLFVLIPEVDLPEPELRKKYEPRLKEVADKAKLVPPLTIVKEKKLLPRLEVKPESGITLVLVKDLKILQKQELSEEELKKLSPDKIQALLAKVAAALP